MSWSFLISVANLLLSFSVSVIVARLLGADGFSSYVLVTAWISMFGMVLSAGFGNVVRRYTASYESYSDWTKLRGLVSFFSMVVASLSIAVGLVVWVVFGGDGGNGAVVQAVAVGIGVLLLGLTAVTSECLSGLQKVVLAQVASVLRPLTLLFFLGGSVVVVGREIDPQLVVWGFVLSLFAGTGFAAVTLIRLWPDRVVAGRLDFEVGTWVSGGAFLLFAASMHASKTYLDVLMVGWLGSEQDAGIYRAVTRGSELVLLGLGAVVPSVGPLVARQSAVGRLSETQRTLTQLARLGLVISMPPMIVMVFFGEVFLGLFGREFLVGVEGLRVLAIANYLGVALGGVAMVLMMTGHHRAVAWSLGAAVLFNVALNFFLIPRFGALGAAYAKATSHVLVSTYMFWKIRESLGLDTSALGVRSWFGAGGRLRPS